MMKRIASAIVLVVAFVASAGASAQSSGLRRYSPYGRVMNAVALDASSTTFAINLDQADQKGVYDLLLLWFSLTDANDSTTAITMSCTASRDSGTTDYAMQYCSTTSGVCTSTTTSWVRDPSAMTTKNWLWRIDVSGVPEIECTITDTNGAAADLLTVYAGFAVAG